MNKPIVYTYVPIKVYFTHKRDLINNIKSTLEIHKIDYEERTKASPTEIKSLISLMRKNRPKLRDTDKQKTRTDTWNYNTLTQSPIIYYDEIAYPSWWLEDNKNLETLIWKIKQDNKIKPKLKIKRITKSTRRLNKINLSIEGMARVNITILQIINGINIYEIMEEWTEKEKEAGMILWRLAQHMKANDLNLMASMMIQKANAADPYSEINDSD